MRTLAVLILSVCAVSSAQVAVVDRSAAYYNYAMAHIYANLAGEGIDTNNNINEAIAAYKAAMAADPRSALLAEELSDFYIQTNRINQARSEAEAAIQRNPNDIAAHRLLARIYVRLVSDAQGQRVDQTMLRRALDEYQKIVDLDPNDVDAWIFLGRLQRASQNIDAAGRAFDKALALEPDNEDALMGKAGVFADKGDNEGATAMIEKAAQKNPSAANWQKLAAGYEQLKEYDLAAETIRKALAFSPENAQDLRKALAQDLINARKFEEAAQAYESVITGDPEDAESLLRLSQLRMQLGDIAGAREVAAKASKVDPDSIEIAFNEVTLLSAEGRPKEAIAKLRGLIDDTARPQYTAQQRASRMALLERLAVMHRMMDQPDPAVAAYREMLTLEPAQDARLTAEIIEAYRGGKKFTDAEREADAAIKKFPQDRDLLLVRASLDADMGRNDAAIAQVRRLLDGRDDRSIHMALAELYQKGRKFDDARKSLDEAEKLSKEEEERSTIWFMRGAMYEKMKDLPRAETEFRKVLGLAPDHVQTLNYLGYMLTDRNVRLNEALTMIEKAVKQDPSNGAYLDSLGWVYFRLGRFAEAEQQLKRAVELAPGDPTMHEHYAEALLQQKKVPEAITSFEEALRHWQASAPAEKDQAEIDKVRAKLDQVRRQLAR
jgi:tetratricopeptide (TPR) repeat protein